MTTISSNDHVEMNPSDVGNNDRYVVQEIIKEMAKSRPVDVNGNRGFKVLVLNEVDKLSREAQAGLRRTMEKYSSACRLIMVCNNVSKCGFSPPFAPSLPPFAPFSSLPTPITPSF